MPISDDDLSVDALTVRYGAVEAVCGVSLRVARGEIHALLGSNGGGKSSLLRAISGLRKPHSGSVTLAGKRIDGWPAHRITRSGVAHVPEGRRVVAPLSVEQNLLLAGDGAGRRNRNEMQAGLDEVYELFPRLREYRSQPSGLLSGGEQQMLAIGRAIMAAPDFLLLDEPSMGLAPIVVDGIFKLLGSRTGTLASAGILLSEQSTSMALEVANTVSVLTRGRTVFQGPVENLDHDVMVTAYLGASRRGEAVSVEVRGDRNVS